MDGWNTSFLFGMAYFQGAMLVLGRVIFNLLISKELLLLSWFSFSPFFVQWTWKYILVKHHSSFTSLSCVRGRPCCWCQTYVHPEVSGKRRLQSDTMILSNFVSLPKSGIIHLFENTSLTHDTLCPCDSIASSTTTIKRPNGLIVPPSPTMAANPANAHAPGILKELPWKHHI